MTGIVPRTFVRTLDVNGKEILTDSEGYILNRDDWSEDYAEALARQEGPVLSAEHWEVIRFLRDFFREHGVQANVREMIKHYRKKWGPEKAATATGTRSFRAAVRRSRETGWPACCAPRASTDSLHKGLSCRQIKAPRCIG